MNKKISGNNFLSFILSFIYLFLIGISNADEKNIKTRSGHNSENLKPVQITISPDLLDIDKALELKSKYKIAKEFSIQTDQSLKKKKKLNIEVVQKIFLRTM